MKRSKATKAASLDFGWFAIGVVLCLVAPLCVFAARTWVPEIQRRGLDKDHERMGSLRVRRQRLKTTLIATWRICWELKRLAEGAAGCVQSYDV